jgi:hypothetical protein
LTKERAKTCISSHHDSPKYGKHYSAEEIADIFAPAQSAVDSIQDWLLSAGIKAEKISQSVNKQWLQFDASAEELESLVDAEYHVYEHTGTGKSTVACDKYAALFRPFLFSTDLRPGTTSPLTFKSTSTTSPLVSSSSPRIKKKDPRRISTSAPLGSRATRAKQAFLHLYPSPLK